MTQFILFNAALFGLAVALITPWRLWVRCGLGCAVVGAGLVLSSPLDPSPRTVLIAAMTDPLGKQKMIVLERRYRPFGTLFSHNPRTLIDASLDFAARRSNPIEDARADIQRELIGLITMTSTRVGGPLRAPGLTCGRPGRPDWATVARFNHFSALSRHDHRRLAGGDYYRYATAYNRYVFANTNLGNEDCRPSRW